jgi:hypothetical protein
MPPSKYVDHGEIRKLFNDGTYFDRTETGELLIEVTDVGPSKPYPGFRSQTVRYRNQQGRTVAIVHQYGDEHGNPVEGTQPDPKYLFHKGIRYRPFAVDPWTKP